MHDSIIEHLALQMESMAEWRKGRAESVEPTTATLMRDSADELMRMAERLRDFQGGDWYRTYRQCLSDDNRALTISEKELEELGSLYFVAVEPEEFFEQLVRATEH